MLAKGVPNKIEFASSFQILNRTFLCVQFEHSAVLKEMTKEAERAEKLEKKLKVITHGYITREKGLKETIQIAWSTLTVMLSTSFVLMPKFEVSVDVCSSDDWLTRTTPCKFKEQLRLSKYTQT